MVEVPVTLADEDGASVHAVFGWSSAEPAVVWVAFPPDRHHPEEFRWEFDRELLAVGIDKPAGVGDVKVRPEGRRGVAIEITGVDPAQDPIAPLLGMSRDCAFRATAARDRIVYFLRRTYGVVPRGREVAEEVVDDLIARCLDGVS